jgi:hypothetical protein
MQSQVEPGCAASLRQDRLTNGGLLVSTIGPNGPNVAIGMLCTGYRLMYR